MDNTSETTPTILRWETLSKKKFDRLDRSQCVVLVTCSPLEVHGPHLPFGADCLEGQGLAQRVVQHLPEPHRSRTFLQLPFIYTATDTVPQPGSIFFHQATTMRVLTDLGRSLAAQGFRDIIVSNFHGSPRHFLTVEAACDKVSRERNVRMVSVFSLMLTRLTNGATELYGVLGDIPGVNADDLIGDTHGGLVETSQLLALHPEWVERDYASLPRQTVESWLEKQGETVDTSLKRGEPTGVVAMVKMFKGAVRFFQAESYAGAPGNASAEVGERILDTLARHAAEAVSEIFEGKIPREQWHSPLWKKRFLFLNPVIVRLSNLFFGITKGIA